jgi:DNA-binding transcriptional LysR family regulator
MSEQLDVGRLRLLREVALRGTIAAAARSMGLTASAVSQQLAVLEREAGLGLLERSSRGVELTGAGHLLVDRTQAIVDLLAQARADLDGIGEEVAGPVSVTAVASAALAFVSAAACALRSSRPRIELRVTTGEPAVSMAMLAAGDADIAVVDEYDYVPLALPDYARIDQLMRDPLVVVAAPGVLTGARARRAGGPHEEPGIRLEDLSGHEWVMPPDDAACGTAVRSACRAAGFEPRVRWESDDLAVLAGAVAAGHGIAVLPRLAVGPAAGLELHELSQPGLHRRISSVVRTSVQGRAVVREVLRAISDQAAPGSRTPA